MGLHEYVSNSWFLRSNSSLVSWSLNTGHLNLLLSDFSFLSSDLIVKVAAGTSALECWPFTWNSICFMHSDMSLPVLTVGQSLYSHFIVVDMIKLLLKILMISWRSWKLLNPGFW